MAADGARYDRVAALLHWLTAVLVIALVVIGIGGEAVGKPFGYTGLETIFLHKSLGLTVFVLTLLRLGWRLGHTPPPLPETTPAWQRRAAHAMHGALYALMLALPVLGYVLSSGGPFPLEWFGVGLPKLAVSKAIADAAHEAHEIGGIAMAALLVLHVGAALWHQYVLKDHLLARMRLG